MRASVEMTSPLVGDLPRGSHVVVYERGVTRTGAARCRVVAGDAQGWLSEKVLAPADGVAADVKAAFPITHFARESSSMASNLDVG